MATILMVDDDVDLVNAVKMLLEARGHRFLAARNGEEGLQQVKADRPDLIILDVMMDRYTEGFRVSQTLRDPEDSSPYAPYRTIPILVLTSIHRTTTHRFAPREDSLPVDAFLEKPVPADELLATVDTLLRKAATARA
jgi:CheY-like chemotaxis protein